MSENSKSEDENIRRRRLTVLSSTELAKDISSLTVDDDSQGNTATSTSTIIQAEDQPKPFIISTFCGYSKRGIVAGGKAKKNQDTLVMSEDSNTRSLVVAVYDGHGEVGELVSQYIEKRMTNELFSHTKFIENPREAYCEILRSLEQRMLADPTIETSFSGTTAVAAIIRDDKITVINVGDSRCAIGSRDKNGKIIARGLSEDHKPGIPAERSRILATGGRVFALHYDDGDDAPERVWLANIDAPGLAMSRSICDLVAHTVGVSSEPDITETTLTEGRDCLIITASDGLWEFISNQEAIDIAAKCPDPRDAVLKLLQESEIRWRQVEEVVDDTTICVAFVKGFEGNELIG